MGYRIGDDSIRLRRSILEGGEGRVVRAAGGQCVTDTTKEIEQSPPIRRAFPGIAGGAGTHQTVQISRNEPCDIAFSSGTID